MIEARLYQILDNNLVRCNLCGHRCVIKPGNKGVCQVRQNLDGKLYTLVYGGIISYHVDPIEKKPLYHFLPGSNAFSIATPGCNFQCQWCQNWEIAQMPRHYGLQMQQFTPPEEVVSAAQASGCASIAYTYTEPTIFYEYAYDVAVLAKQAGIYNVYVTNGYMTEEMLEAFHPYLDAANVDLKAFNKKTYHKFVGAGLQQVLDSMVKMKELGIWLEVTTLVIPGVNDDPAELRDAAQFVAQELGSDTPWHISRFFPNYKMGKVPPTPLATMQRAQQAGIEAGLKYVYLGNLHDESDTCCPQCGQVLIQRQGYYVRANRIQDGKCSHCGTPIAGKWE
jgi:pyruvate formate lyase activating enzyme